jgi:hypothetical protein
MAQYATLNIEVVKGATFSWTLTLKDENGDAIDLSTVSSFTGGIRKRKQDTDTLINFSFSTLDAAAGKTTWLITDENTDTLPYGTHFYEVFMNFTDGTVQKVFQGEAKVI